MLPLDPDKSASSGDVTLLLSAWIEGDQRALDSLVPLVYSELHRIARNHWSRQPARHTLQPTAIVNEAFLRLMSFSDARDEDANSANPKSRSGFRDRSHFYAVASMAMRQILVNHARASLAGKRGGIGTELPSGMWTRACIWKRKMCSPCTTRLRRFRSWMNARRGS